MKFFLLIFFFSNLFQEIKLLAENKFTFIDLVCDPKSLPSQIKFFMKSQPVMIITHHMDIYRKLRNHGIDVPIIIPQGELSIIPQDKNTSIYMVDDYQVGVLAAVELIEQGYQNNLMIFPSSRGRVVKERLEGFVSEFSRLNGSTEHLICLDLHPKTIENLCKSIDFNKIDSLFCFSDAIAIYMNRYLMKQGLNPPKKCGLIGTDNLYWGEFIYPSLTTMDLKEKVMAERIICDVVDIICGRKFISGQMKFPVELIRRESTSLNRT